MHNSLLLSLALIVGVVADVSHLGYHYHGPSTRSIHDAVGSGSSFNDGQGDISFGSTVTSAQSSGVNQQQSIPYHTVPVSQVNYQPEYHTSSTAQQLPVFNTAVVNQPAAAYNQAPVYQTGYVEQPAYTTSQTSGIEYQSGPVYQSSPVYQSAPVYESAPAVYQQASVSQQAPSYHTAAVSQPSFTITQSAPAYETAAVHQSAPVYQPAVGKLDTSIISSAPAYQQTPVYQQTAVYQTAPVSQTTATFNQNFLPSSATASSVSDSFAGVYDKGVVGTDFGNTIDGSEDNSNGYHYEDPRLRRVYRQSVYAQ
uniref:Uncharacterized protein n=1 Tax=Stomoxys calcitrans TaxID=35570 RepID=A0A1I8QA18_STOCA